MIYTQNGYVGNVMQCHSITVTAFEWLKSYQVTQIKPKSRQSLKDIKCKQAPYFISGYIEQNEKGGYIRNNDNLIRRDLIIVDYDDIPLSIDEFKQHIHAKLSQYNYMLYPSISHRTDNPRYRLVIEPSRPMIKHEYKHMLTTLGDYIGLPYDPASHTWGQLMGLPVTVGKVEAYKMIINDGVPYPIPNHIDIPKKAKATTQPIQHSVIHDGAIATFKKYLDRERENLQQRDGNYLSVIMVLAKAVLTEEIDEVTAFECVKLLAYGNSEWENNNIEHLRKELERANGNPNAFSTAYSFMGKFSYNTIQQSEQEPPKTMKELEKLLKDIGESWRLTNAKINEKTGEVREPLMPANVIANTLLKYHNFRLISYNHNADDSPTYVYNIDTGLYENSENLLNKLIRRVEYRSTPNMWKHTMQIIRQEAPKLKPFNNRFLIPVYNGVFDLKDKKLLPFSPRYPITQKIKTSLNFNADNPKYFNVDEWFKSLACNDNEIVTLLWQFINEAVNPNHTRKKIGFLLGGGASQGNNGKGTYQDLIKNLIGHENVATLKPEQFAERFKVAQLQSAICNIGDDISSSYIDTVSNLMSIATGDTITIEEKNKPAFTIHTKPFCIFSANEMPRVQNKSGWHRRVCIVPFNADFNGQVENTDIKDKYVKDKNVLEYVLKKVLFMDFEKFIEPKAVIDELEEYKKENDYIIAYIDDRYIPAEYHLVDRVPVTFIKADLEEFFEEQKIKQHIPYRFVKDFVFKLSKQSQGVYTLVSQRITNDIKSNMPYKMRDYVKSYPERMVQRNKNM